MNGSLGNSSRDEPPRCYLGHSSASRSDRQKSRKQGHRQLVSSLICTCAASSLPCYPRRPIRHRIEMTFLSLQLPRYLNVVRHALVSRQTGPSFGSSPRPSQEASAPRCASRCFSCWCQPPLSLGPIRSIPTMMYHHRTHQKRCVLPHTQTSTVGA